MNDELMRRISDALDAPGGIEADAELRAQLQEDREAAAYTRDVEAISRALGARRPALDRDRDWDALAEKIDLALEGPFADGLADIDDPTLPPRLEGDELETGSPVRSGVHRGRRDVAPAEPARATAPVVDLASRRAGRGGRLALVGGLAAAAAVGLGITFGLGSPGSDEASVAMAPAPMQMEEAAAEAPGVFPPPAPVAQAAPAYGGGGDVLAFAADEAEGAPGWEGVATAEPEAEPAAEMPAAATVTTARGRVDSLRDQAMGSAPARSPRPMAAPARIAPSSGAVGGAEVTAADAQRALARVTDAVRRCMGEEREVARVRVTVRGADGAITEARVGPPFAGTSAGQCMEAAVSAVRMPVSREPSYSIGYAYRPAPIAGNGSSGPNAVRARRAAPAMSREVVDPWGR